MTQALMDVCPPSKEAEPQPYAEELDAARALVRQARARGVVLTGPDGLLKALTKTVIETALDEEMSEHLGYDKHDRSGRNLANSRNGITFKTVLTGAVDQVDLEGPRHRDGTFEPVIVKKRQRRISEAGGSPASTDSSDCFPDPDPPREDRALPPECRGPGGGTHWCRA